MIKRQLKRLVKFIDGLTLNQLRFGMWFIAGLTAICLSPFMTAKIVSLLSFVSGCIVVVWSFSWLYE